MFQKLPPEPPPPFDLLPIFSPGPPLSRILKIYSLHMKFAVKFSAVLIRKQHYWSEILQNSEQGRRCLNRLIYSINAYPYTHMYVT